MTFGITDSLMPVSAVGEVNNVVHLVWLERRRRSESETEEENALSNTVEPLPSDVLLGRGKLIQGHVGNQCYRTIIESHRGRYEQALKVEKTFIAKEIVQTVKNVGGRFLKQKTDGGWVEVDTEVARDKVSHSFRNRRITTGTNAGGWKDLRWPIPNEPVSSTSAMPAKAESDGLWKSQSSPSTTLQRKQQAIKCTLAV
jgi:hypothetical protein